jgi:hypothetical protein
MATHPPARPSDPLEPYSVPDTPAAAPDCLNCGASLVGAYCAACGQPAVDLAAPTWHVIREALAEVTDLDGRMLRTVRALASPGRLTVEFLRGRRASYIGPLKLFLLAGTILTTTWILTRGVDARFYNLSRGGSAGTYIDTVVRGSLAASVAVAVSSWVLGGRRRRLLDEAVFALHLVAALSVGAAVVVWLGTAWKLVWGTATAVPGGVPALPYLLFLPACAGGLAYVVGALGRVHGGAWWAIVLRAVVLSAVGLAAVTWTILAGPT